MVEKKSHISKKLKYAQSAVDYLGLVSWSFVVRFNNAVEKVGNSMVEGLLKPFSSSKKKQPHRKPKSLKSLKYLKKSEQKKEEQKKEFEQKRESEQKILQLESSISELEKRLTRLEKNGVTTIAQSSVQKPEEKKEVCKENKAILRMLVDDNKRLKNMLKSQHIK